MAELTEERKMKVSTDHFDGMLDEQQFMALEMLVSAFSDRMRQSLLRSYFRKGRIGWDEPGWDRDDIVKQLLAHVEKMQPIDVAIFAAFWWNRLEGDMDHGCPIEKTTLGTERHEITDAS
jgi:hypothetical protein